MALNDAHRGIDSSDGIENKHITTVEDQLNSADASVSGGSDTENSRADGARYKDGDSGHGRTNSSARKPATFKAVSVNKTFLAAKASTNIASPKGSEKPSPSSSTPPPGSATLSVSRPRLVAKTGSGTRENAPRLSAVNAREPASAPDPSAVWNKNRPPSAPQPKKYTDEELKKYGIHMASRLIEDDAQGQSKWADVEDDDDDWALKAITWGDGTKTTLPRADEHHSPPPPSDTGSHVSREVVLDKPASPAPAPAPATAPAPAPITARIDAPVASPLPKSSSLASGKGLVLKSSSHEKPTLISAPSAQPAPAKSPWATLPPIDKTSPATADLGPFTRSVAKEQYTSKGAFPPREIAADDFNRSSWRDGGSQGNRELYNSHSGRYEPVGDRRGSVRAESQARHPSLLQRTPQAEQAMEGSGAFQLSRAGQDAPFGRRRGSSNVSSGSGPHFPRTGKGAEGAMPPPEILGARRTSLSGSNESPVSPSNVPITMQQSRQPGSGPWVRSSPRATGAVPYDSSGPSSSIPEQVQGVGQNNMDEVEYQKKLMRERVELARKRRQDEEAQEEAARRERIQKKLEALGPPPEKKSDKKDVISRDDASKTAHAIQQREETIATPETAPVTQVPQGPPGSEAAVDQETSNAEYQESAVSPVPVAKSLSHDRDTKQPLWAGSGPRQERFASWGSPAPTPPSRNVWGSPDNDRGLGNGTFNPDLGRMTGSTVPAQQGSQGPAPIGPPGGNVAPSQDRPHPQPPIGSRSSRYGVPGSDLASKWVAAVADNDRKISATKLAERNDRDRQLAERGMKIEDIQPTIKDTWRPVHVPGDGSRRAMGPAEVQSHHNTLWKTASSQEELAKGIPPPEDAATSTIPGVIGSGNNSILPQAAQSSSSQPRTSRFFPAKESRVEAPSNIGPSRPNSPSPPPPTMEGHPAYEGDAMHPHVSLPKPQPIVKLPPMSFAQTAHTRSNGPSWGPSTPQRDVNNRNTPVPQHHATVRHSEKTQENWQNRINNLLNGGKAPTPKSIGVDPASKRALDHTVPQHLATVSLPSTSPRSDFGVQRSPLSKPMAEECFEEQEMGSLPQIRLPHKAPEALWEPAEAPTKPMPKRFMVHASIMEPYYFTAEVVGGGNAMKISLPGMEEAKIVTIPFSMARSGRSSQSRGGTRSRGPGHGSRVGKRETSGNLGERTPSHGSGRGGRGSYRSRGVKQ